MTSGGSRQTLGLFPHLVIKNGHLDLPELGSPVSCIGSVDHAAILYETEPSVMWLEELLTL